MKTLIQTILTTLLIIAEIMAYAQSSTNHGQGIAVSNPGGILETFDLERISMDKESIFIHDHWSIGSAFLYDGNSFRKCPMKYNLLDDYLIIKDMNGISKKLLLNKIKKFQWFDIKTKKNVFYINCLEYENDNTHLSGFAELLIEGKINLLLYRNLAIVKGNYIITHDAGQRNDEYLVEEMYYVNIDNKLYPANKKKYIMHLLKDRRNEIEEFVNSNNLKYNDKEGLIRIVNFYNSL